MRVSVFPVVVSLCLSSCLSLSLAASAADLKVKVIDPQGAAVGRAQVSLLRSHDSKVMATQITSAEGVAILSLVDGERYQVQVLAPGFAVETVEVPASSSESRSRIGVEITVNLRLATASETVVVTATRTPGVVCRHAADGAYVRAGFVRVCGTVYGDASRRVGRRG
jgi:hypothetical protein